MPEELSVHLASVQGVLSLKIFRKEKKRRVALKNKSMNEAINAADFTLAITDQSLGPEKKRRTTRSIAVQGQEDNENEGEGEGEGEDGQDSLIAIGAES